MPTHTSSVLLIKPLDDDSLDCNREVSSDLNSLNDDPSNEETSSNVEDISATPSAPQSKYHQENRVNNERELSSSVSLEDVVSKFSSTDQNRRILLS